jgi:hypothetical protein
LFAGRLDDPRQHQLPEHLIPASGIVEPEHVVGTTQGIPPMGHPRGGDLQRACTDRGIQPEIELPMVLSQTGCRLERLKLRLVVRGPDVLDVAGTAPRGVHDLHHH